MAGRGGSGPGASGAGDCHLRPAAASRPRLAVLGDASPTWRPTRYEQNLWGCRVGITFPVVKLRDYAARWEALEASDNPFAMVVMAHLQARATRRDPEGRLQGKLRLIRQLYERGYARQDVLELPGPFSC